MPSAILSYPSSGETGEAAEYKILTGVISVVVVITGKEGGKAPPSRGESGGRIRLTISDSAAAGSSRLPLASLAIYEDADEDNRDDVAAPGGVG